LASLAEPRDESTPFIPRSKKVWWRTPLSKLADLPDSIKS
jgi:hypothetical protein